MNVPEGPAEGSELHGSYGATRMTIMSDKERAEALEHGMVNLVALLEPAEVDANGRVSFYEIHRPLVNASSDELEIAVTMLGDAEDEAEDDTESEHFAKLADYYHNRWQHLQEGGSVGATTEEEVVAEMDKFDTWLGENDPEYQLVHRELDATINRIAKEMGVSIKAATTAYNTGEAW